MLPILLRDPLIGALVKIPDGCVIIKGGINVEVDIAIGSAECLSLITLQNGWRNIAPLPEPICASAVIYVHDVVIISGGEGEDERLLSTVYALKPPQLPLLNEAEEAGFASTSSRFGQWTKLSAELPSPSSVNCICRVGEELFTFREFGIYHLTVFKPLTSCRL